MYKVMFIGILVHIKVYFNFLFELIIVNFDGY